MTETDLREIVKLARDKDAFVRTEAYDSLCVFLTKDIELFLRYAIKRERNELACYYAILSWTDIICE